MKKKKNRKIILKKNNFYFFMDEKKFYPFSSWMKIKENDHGQKRASQGFCRRALYVKESYKSDHFQF